MDLSIHGSMDAIGCSHAYFRKIVVEPVRRCRNSTRQPRHIPIRGFTSYTYPFTQSHVRARGVTCSRGRATRPRPPCVHPEKRCGPLARQSKVCRAGIARLQSHSHAAVRPTAPTGQRWHHGTMQRQFTVEHEVTWAGTATPFPG